jgi:hypothetical protein
MTKIASVVVAAVAVVSVTVLGEATVQPSRGDGAYARTSTECYRKCKVYNWSALHCLRRCRGRWQCRMLDQPYVPEKPGNSALGQEHVEIRGRALPEMVGMLFKERACSLPPLRTEHQ